MGRKANKPFYLEKICIRIYSAEELAYCICENPELLDEDVFSKELCTWLSEECSARDLADKIAKATEGRNCLEACVRTVLDDASFIGAAERNQIIDIIKVGDSSDSLRKRKSHADYFLKRERYTHAITEYEKILDGIAPDENYLRGEVYHNMGIAKARLFLFSQAADDFKKAFEADGSSRHFYMYAAALRMFLPEREYVRIISEEEGMGDVVLELEEKMGKTVDAWHDDEQFKDFAEKKAEGALEGVTKYYGWVDGKLSELKDDYHRFVL